MPKILIGTNNLGKQKEIYAILSELKAEMITPTMLGLRLDVEEDGSTYQENAAKKAVAFAQASGLISLADDTGLEVEALNGAPGLYSARFAPGAQATDADRRNYLLQRLQNHPQPWQARFRCILAIAKPGGSVAFTEGICQGEIIPDERGLHGFGYDSIFLIPSIGRTMAELSMEEKNQLSHRALAVNAARPILLQLLTSNES
jgi:XTP/dITP diphosphohydrolase